MTISPIESQDSGEPANGAKADRHVVVVFRSSDFDNCPDSETAALIAAHSSALKELSTNVETVLVSPQSEDGEISKAVDRVIEGKLSDAFVDSNSGLNFVAVIDAGVQLDAAGWEWLFQSAAQAEIVCSYSRSRLSGRWYTRIFETFGRVVGRLVLGHGKSRFHPGVVICSGTSPKTLAELINHQEAEFECPEQLVTLARSAGCSVLEASVTGPFSDAASNTLLSKPTLTMRGVVSVHADSVRFWWSQIVFPGSQTGAKASAGDRAAEKGSDWSLRTRWYTSAALLLAAGLLFFSNSAYPLFEPDETRNAQLALNILDSGDWMSLSLGGEPYWDKPPLQAWMTAASYRIFGAGEASTRLPCAVASLLTLLILLGCGTPLIGFRSAFFGACLLLLCCGFSIIGRYVTMDATLTCLATAMLLFTLLGIRGDTLKARWLVAAGIACGLGFLSKGPVIAIIVLPPLLIAGWLERKTFYKSPWFWLYPGVPAFLVSAPWFLATSYINPEFVTYFFWKHNVVRFSAAFNHQQPWWFYLPILLAMMYPVCLLLPSLLKLVFSAGRRERLALGEQFPWLVLYAGWILFFFSMSQSKLPTYILPALPAICLLTGKLLAQSVFEDGCAIEPDKWLRTMPRRVTWSVLPMSIAMVGGIVLVLSRIDPRLVWLASGLALLLLTGIYLFRNKDGAQPRRRVAWGLSFVIAFGFVMLASTVLIPGIAYQRSVQLAVTQLAATAGFEDCPVVFVGRAPNGISFQVEDEKAVEYFSGRELKRAAAFLARYPCAIVVASDGDVEKLEEESEFGQQIETNPRHRKLYVVHSIMPGDARSAVHPDLPQPVVQSR